MNRRKSKNPLSKKAFWTDNQKLEAVATYLNVGTLTGTALVTGVPHSTLEKWKTTPFWKEAVLKLQAEDAQELDSSMQKIVQRALKAVQDRLDNGDTVWDHKAQEIVRVPVKAQTALNITKDLLKEQKAIRQGPQQKEKEETINSRLLKLAENFAALAQDNTKKPSPVVLDIPMVEIVKQEDS
jgi:hypothetical protein